TTTWVTSDNKTIKTIHPPSEKIQINIQNNQFHAAHFKLQNETNNIQITTSETNKIIEQNNYTNKYLQTLGSLSRIENTIQKVKQNYLKNETKTQPQKIKPLFTPYKYDSVQKVNNQLSAIKVDPLKIESLTSYYYRSTYPDLQIKKRGKFIETSYQSGTIYEWNIDGMNEYHIINKLQEMTMVSNAHKIKNNTDKTVVNLLITGFTGQLKCWWDNILTTQQQTKILDAIQVNELKQPILDNNNETIEDAVSILIYNITKYFIGDPTYLKDRKTDQLSNIRCRKL
ncbi:LOW QUALITY PROTEIN: hypothetical protein CFOL_v3_26777, partial [Cephalotus follicularis]